MNTKAFETWLRQPTTIHGIAAIAAWIGGAIAWRAGVGAAGASGVASGCFALVCVLLNDNTAKMTQAEQGVLQEVLQAHGDLRAQLPKIIIDAIKAIAAAEKPPHA